MNRRRIVRSLRIAPVVVAFAAFGCGGAAVPHQELTNAKSAISAAEAADASTVPQATLHLQMAKDAVHEAQGLIDDGDNERAAKELVRARADAQLALALAKQESARADADAELAKIQELEKEAAQ
ncbi:MAG: DUF4398 domain-containing protein [Myxococcales bacterium]|nr:DUF4398 domain-containing protein [Myxococcales bacterium]MCB9575488.1 DUF4398 domain-containing protein [Polyangiaceae bacterium]